jgi:hypothetical protein
MSFYTTSPLTSRPQRMICRAMKLALALAVVAILWQSVDWSEAAGRCRRFRRRHYSEPSWAWTTWPSEPGTFVPGSTQGVRTLGTQPVAAGDLPNMPVKPTPQSSVFMGCPPEGMGGDTALNRLKNREDVAQRWFPVRFDAVSQLEYPDTIGRKPRADWDPEDTAAVARYEGIPISIQGYLAGVRQEGKESCNCERTEPDRVDYHVWLIAASGQGKKDSIVVELTPRLRARHPAWRLPGVQALVDNEEQVRISGWLMMDQEHPEQIGRTRATLWEIHPVMEIEVLRGGSWIKLDDLGASSGTGKSRPTRTWAGLAVAN